ncbi:hypothetical protein [Streptomyces sp. BE303]|uniref:hypothetical protein n=1 Tax=Streptomyces sp. BE303 TaxID=3002528 RepID=UPI002E79F4DD|nr:hypothetical protein [Streptomyces sp. BE303]MED7951539.1 hypothetical protein [Streptomyces sp. BE303]
MEPGYIAIAALLVLAALLAVVLPRLRSRRLHARFGPEYDNAVLGHDGQVRLAEQELSDRISRHRSLRITPLDAADRDRAAAELQGLQALFVEDPLRAVAEADSLLDTVLGRMGYPEKGRLEAVSVDHPAALARYRTARRTLVRAQGGEAGDSEALRMALIAVRDLAQELLHRTRQGALATR